MDYKDLMPDEILNNSAKNVKLAVEFVDELSKKGGVSREDIVPMLTERFRDNKEALTFALGFLTYIESDEDEPEDSNEEALDFGDWDDEDEEGFEIEYEDFEQVPLGDGCCLYCDITESKENTTIKKVLRSLTPEKGHFLHIDLEVPDINKVEELLMTVSLKKGGPRFKFSFNKGTIPYFSDGNHLHFPAIETTELFDEGYALQEGETDNVIITIQKYGRRIGMYPICVYGPLSLNSDTDEKSKITFGKIAQLQAEVNQYEGWENFKARVDSMITRAKIDDLRYKLGMTQNIPLIHSAIIGNPGTGKTTAVELMAKLYYEMGLLATDRVWTTNVSTLATSGINSENEAVASAVSEAHGGTLVIDRAHELYKTDKPSYDTEGRIVRALVDALKDKKKYGRWMLVLSGEPVGMEYLLSSCPELKNSLSKPIYLEDFKADELYRMFDRCAENCNLKLSDGARQKLQMYILHQYNHRGVGFKNASLVKDLFNNDIIPAMYSRLRREEADSKEQLELILPEDIPAVGDNLGNGLDELEGLIGLGRIKSKVRDYLNAVRLASRRMELGLPANMPRLHMAFLGNPGTGKTTVAEIIGRVFASWGILSEGRVIRTEKSQMVGQYIGETEYKMTNLLARAKGNILFIDEAYQLAEGDEKDHGRIVMNSLLTELGKENPDIVVILAGYTAPMKKLLESNEGIESRFPNVFNFEDYTTDELMEIGRLMIHRQGFTITDAAAANMRRIIEEESDKPSPRFGNGRFVSNLLQNEILATLGARTAKINNPTKEDLSTILPEDVVVDKALKDVVFDDVAIDAALAKLDALAGLDGVKKAIHNFVQSARYLHSIGEPYVGKGLLSWRFVGNSGTGKSTVAGIMAEVLRGMRLIANSHITEIKGERIFNVSERDCDEVLREAVKKSCNGLIFIDVDDPKFSDGRMNYGRSVEQIRLKVNELTVETGGECALILAELNAPNGSVAEQLSETGIYEFDHTLVFKDYTVEELFQILNLCLDKHNVSFTPEAKGHICNYLKEMKGSVGANARTMKLMSRTIHQQVILREASLPKRSTAHQVLLEDVETFRWDGRKGRIGF